MGAGQKSYTTYMYNVIIATIYYRCYFLKTAVKALKLMTTKHQSSKYLRLIYNVMLVGFTKHSVLARASP